MPSERAYHDELEAIRKGRGVQEPLVRDRIGPDLRSLYGIGADTSHSDARRILIESLSAACNNLPDELKFAARVMFAIENGYHHRFLRQRYDALAARWNCDFRTVQRRCDEALRLICQHLGAQDRQGRAAPVQADVFSADAWYLERFSAVLLLDRERPEAIEERTLVSTRDGLSEIGVAFGVPRHSKENKPQLELDMEMLYGARLELVRQVSENLLVHHLALPRPLSHGERHTYARVVRIPEGQRMVPRYVHVPPHRCDLFELRVRFDLTALPRAVWLVSRVPELVFTNNQPGRDRIEPDVFGEVYVRFTDLQLGFGYGLSWLPARDDE